MKVRRDMLDMALTTAKDSEVPLWPAGDDGVITEGVIAYDYGLERCVLKRDVF